MRTLKIHDIRSFVNGLLCTIISLICFGAILLKGFNIRYLIALVIIIAFGFVSFISSFSKKETSKWIEKCVDERDKYIVMKSGHKTIKTANWIFFIAADTMLFLYCFTKNILLLTSAITLCVVILVLFGLLLWFNIYYNKKE